METDIRAVIPASELATIIDNIGLPASGTNLSYNNSGTVGPADADIIVMLKGNHRPTDDYVRALRRRLPESFPGVVFYFLPADIVSQILNFGLPAPIDIQVIGRNLDANRKFALDLLNKLKQVTGIFSWVHPDDLIVVDADAGNVRINPGATAVARFRTGRG